jgi:hypothetical protein
MDIEVIEVEVDDEAKTSALGALSDAQAAKALRLETERAPSPRIMPPRATKSAPATKADGTQEIELGDVLEVMQKMPGSEGAAKAAPSVELAATPIATASPLNPNATVEVRPGDVLEEIVLDEQPAPVQVQAQVVQAQAHVQTAPMQMQAPIANAGESIPLPAASASDLQATRVRPPSGPQRAPLAQFSIDDEVAPFASDTVDIPLDRVPGLPIWLQVKGKPGVAIVGGAIGACALIGALALGMHFHNAGNDTDASNSKTTTTTTTSNAAMNMNHDDPSAAIPPPPATPDVPSVSINDLKKDGNKAAPNSDSTTSHAWAPPHHTSSATHHASAPAAPAATFVSQKHTTAKQPQGFGLIRTWIAARGEPITVDGKAVGVAPSPVRVACGDHTVAIGKEVVQANIPCDGAITVGSPDHKK